MALRHRKPTSPGRRFQTVSDFAELTTSTPEKSLLSPKPKSGGRNAYGRKTSRHRGGGHKQQYRIIDFKRNKDAIPARVAAWLMGLSSDNISPARSPSPITAKASVVHMAACVYWPPFSRRPGG